MIAPLCTKASCATALYILHLEDSVADQKLALRTLRASGLPCRVVCVDTLQDFAAQLRMQRFDLVLADYYLPGFTAMQAWEVLQQQRCEDDSLAGGLSARKSSGTLADTPFVLLSGAIGEAAAVEAIRQGMADYLLKDNMARLPHVLGRALEVAQARRQREQAMRDLARSERQLAELTEHLQQSIEAERAAIAREIHDDIGGALTAVRFDLAWLERNAPDATYAQHARAALDMLHHAFGASQRIMLDLRPPVLDQGLVAAVQWLAENFERRTGVRTLLHTSRAVIDIDPAIQVVAYRTAQEALTNVSKYAAARNVYIDLSDSEGVLTLEVRDDGQGIAAGARGKPKAFGLRGLAERARTVGGWLDVSSQTGRGTSIIVTIPLTDAASAALQDCDEVSSESAPGLCVAQRS